MALVVESSSSNTALTGSVVVTKPTGVAVGDLLFGGFIYYETGSSVAPNTPSGWTSIQSQSGFEGFNIFWRTADASDVSASNYTFSATGGDFIAGFILRISGQASGSEIASSEQDGNAAETNTTITETASISADTSDSLAIMIVCGSYNSATPGTAISYSSFNSTPSLTWTERIDTGPNTNGGGDGASIAVATAPNSGTSNITQYGCTSGEVLDRQYFTILAIINSPQSATGTNALLEVSPTLFAPTASAGTTGTNALLEVSPTMFDQSGKATSPTQWINESKANTTWTNESL